MMEGLGLSHRSLYGNGVTINDLCTSVERSLCFPQFESTGKLCLQRKFGKGVIHRNRRQQRVITRSTLQKHEKKDLVTDYRIVSTVLETPPVFRESLSSWRLDGEIERLRDLQARLGCSKNLAEKVAVLERDIRVQETFSTHVLDSCLKDLNNYDIYLLKCMVASGQEHILRSWNEHARKEVINGFNHNSSPVSAKDIVKGTLQFMSQFIQASGDIKTLKHIGANVSPSLKRSREQEVLRCTMRTFVQVLDDLEKFYDCIGGIVGYQLAALELIKSSETMSNQEEAQKETFYHFPEGKDLSKDQAFATKAAAWGVNGLPFMGEIYPLGGAGDRLGLVDETTKEGLPVAMLPYCGRTLLEGHIRDLQAREYMYFKIHGQQVCTPVAIMTSAAKQNNKRVHDLLESHGWFGRGRDQFQLFEQPLVPTVAAENGRWVASGPLDLVLKPGGHGVIWKLAKDKGVFNWFYSKGRKAAIVRQISNPIASTDLTLLALSGMGLQHRKKFGFASCERKVGAAEGVNVLMETKMPDGRWRYGTSCIEYTEFNRLGIADVPVSTGSLQAKFPANTNVLFVDLKSAEKVATSDGPSSLPGMIMNLKKPITYTDRDGVDHSVRAGRLECTMQNVADSLQNDFRSRLVPIDQEELDTYIIFNKRRKVTSSAKRRRKFGEQSVHQTPDGSFLDVTRNSYDLFTFCGVHMDEMEGNHCYIDVGPPFLALFHPALGPQWDIIRQKIQGGAIFKGSEVQLEIAEFFWKDVEVDGSLIVEAENVMGTCYPNGDGQGMLKYGEGCGRCRLERVQVVNKGVDWSCSNNVYWQNKVKREESLRIVLKGNSEFEATDVVLEGSHLFEVPDGHKMTVVQNLENERGISCIIEPLTSPWSWKYVMRESGEVHLCMGSWVCAMADDATLLDFLTTLDDYLPGIPDELVEYFLATSGFHSPDTRLTRLVAVATQKFVNDIASDALRYSKIRQSKAKGGKLALTSDDLTAALKEFGVNVRKQEYYADNPLPNANAASSVNVKDEPNL